MSLGTISQRNVEKLKLPWSCWTATSIAFSKAALVVGVASINCTNRLRQFQVVRNFTRFALKHAKLDFSLTG